MVDRTKDGELDDGMRAWGAFLRAHADLVPRMDRSLRRRAGVPLRDYDVLTQIDRAGETCTMRDLERRVLLSQSGLSRLVQRLVDEGLVKRAHNEHDRRGVDLRLTAEGRSALRAARKVQAEQVRALFAEQMSATEARTVLRVMRRLSRADDEPDLTD